MLVEAGLIIRRDSPNGKRFARRNGEGGLGEAFGFSLAPLLVRAREIEAQAAQVMAARLEWKRLRERLTLCLGAISPSSSRSRWKRKLLKRMGRDAEAFQSAFR